jgi:hypothetical protein
VSAVRVLPARNTTADLVKHPRPVLFQAVVPRWPVWLEFQRTQSCHEGEQQRPGARLRNRCDRGVKARSSNAYSSARPVLPRVTYEVPGKLTESRLFDPWSCQTARSPHSLPASNIASTRRGGIRVVASDQGRKGAQRTVAGRPRGCGDENPSCYRLISGRRNSTPR